MLRDVKVKVSISYQIQIVIPANVIKSFNSLSYIILPLSVDIFVSVFEGNHFSNQIYLILSSAL